MDTLIQSHLHHQQQHQQQLRNQSRQVLQESELHPASFVGQGVIEDAAFGEALVAANLMAVAVENQIAILELRSEEAKFTAKAAERKGVRLFNNREYTLDDRHRIVCDTTITHVAWSPQGVSLCATGEDMRLRRFVFISSRKNEGNDIVSGDGEAVGWVETFCVQAHSQSINGCDFSKDGDMIATCSDDGTVKVFEGHSGRIYKTYDLLHPLIKVQWSKSDDEPKQLVVADTRGKIRVYKFDDMEDAPLYSLSVGGALVDLAVHPRTSSLLACVTESKWHTFDMAQSSLPLVYGNLANTGTCIRWSKTDPNVFCVGLASSVQVIRLSEDDIHDVIAAETGQATTLCMHTSLPICFAVMGSTIVMIQY
eukprot:m.61625 g.61625  ORF g.61625 m.61625 type:complete len:367 (-) comp7996_c0_seq1:186-1286(-)